MAHRLAKFKKEIAGYTAKELNGRAKEIETNLFNMKMQFKTGQLGSVAALKTNRKELARVKTLETQKAAARSK